MYRDLIKRSHPYEGSAPEKSISEVLPSMTGHDDKVERPQGEPSRWGEPFMVHQGPEKSAAEPHHHPGDDLIDESSKKEDDNPGDDYKKAGVLLLRAY
jgi:hypothetical protein